MEILGIALSVPVPFVASIVYGIIIGKVIRLWQFLSTPLLMFSLLVLSLLTFELIGVLTLGVVRVQEIVGDQYYAIHLGLFFLAVPSMANLLTIQRSVPNLSKWYVIGPVCSILALCSVLLQYDVSETLFGIY